MSAETLYPVFYEDEPQCTLLDGRYFKLIDIDDKVKVRAKYQLCAQKCSIISGDFQRTANFKIHLRGRFNFYYKYYLTQFFGIQLLKNYIAPGANFSRIVLFVSDNS